MSTTIEGGAYQTASGDWVNAEGKPLSKAQIAEAEQLAAERAAAVAKGDRERLELEATRDPTARALAAALRPQPGELLVVEPPAPKGKAKAQSEE